MVGEQGHRTSLVGRQRWNHNIHYGLQLLDLIPPGVTEALDLGCGEGWLTRELSGRIARVVGLDPDLESLSLAEVADDSSDTEYLIGDLLTCPFKPESFDFISCVASLHHMDEEAGLDRLAKLLRPGGVLGVVGLARSRLPLDLPWEVAGAVSTRLHKLTRTYWETPAPKVWPPPHSYSEMRAISRRILPDSTFRRRALWRYVLVWTKPAA